MPHILCNKETACQLLALLSLFRLEDPNPTVETAYRIQFFLLCDLKWIFCAVTSSHTTKQSLISTIK